jgi:hypothetical protein
VFLVQFECARLQIKRKLSLHNALLLLQQSHVVQQSSYASLRIGFHLDHFANKTLFLRLNLSEYLVLLFNLLSVLHL